MAKRTNNFTKLDEFKKKIRFNEQLSLDERDNTILSLLQKHPNISQEEIAKRIKLSQPSVGARIRKLQQKGVLSNINGVNFKIVDLQLAKIDINTTDTKAIIDEFKDCPFFINAVVTSGRYNVMMLFMATDLKRLEGIVNQHLRSNPMVKDIELNIVISMAKDLVLPLNIDFENKNQIECQQKCDDCL